MTYLGTQAIDPASVATGDPLSLDLPRTIGKFARTYDYLLFLRFLVLNASFVAFAVAVTIQGWLTDMFVTDTLHIVKLIVAVFVVGLALVASRIMRISLELNAARDPHPARRTRVREYLDHIRGGDAQTRATFAGLLKIKLASRLEAIRYVANLLVLLGLIGTVIGFIVALSGIRPDAVGNAQAIGPMVATLLEGMAIALYTTLAGSVLNIWLMLNYRLLASGTTRLYTLLVERGEQP